MNHLRANPSKTQVCAFHLRNREAKRQLQVTWSGTALEHCEHPVYLGVTLDRTLSFKTHIEKTKSKVCSRNNILSKLTGTTWGANPQTLKSTALALCYSAAEYACPVWERSKHAKKVNTALNACCRQITGCLRPTPTDNLYTLAGIAPPEIRRRVASMKERQRQVEDIRHPLFNQAPAVSRLTSRESFLKSVVPLTTSTPESTRVTMWEESFSSVPPMGINPREELPAGAECKWTEWKCLNRLRTGIGRCKVLLHKWGYLQDNQDLNCDCGSEPQTMEHLLQCPLLEQACTAEDLAAYNDTAHKCVQHYLNII